MPIGTPYILSAPSGCGKTSLVNALIQSIDQVCISISHTTRAPRPGEQPGTDYHFVSPEEFQQLVAQGAFLEHAKVFGCYYGTSLVWVQENLEQGIDVMLEIDWQGARQIQKKLPQSIGIFILPPSWEALQNRLQRRGQDKSCTITKRMQEARSEMSHYAEYDYLIINTHFEQALHDLQMIILAGRLRTATQMANFGHLTSLSLEFN